MEGGGEFDGIGLRGHQVYSDDTLFLRQRITLLPVFQLSATMHSFDRRAERKQQMTGQSSYIDPSTDTLVCSLHTCPSADHMHVTSRTRYWTRRTTSRQHCRIGSSSLYFVPQTDESSGDRKRSCDFALDDVERNATALLRPLRSYLRIEWWLARGESSQAARNPSSPSSHTRTTPTMLDM